MPFLAFLFQAVLISLSGVMAPGPITAVSISKGTESPHSGALIAIGHGVVEFPLMVLIFYGLGKLLDFDYVRVVISFIGGFFLLVMGISMLRSINIAKVSLSRYTRSSLLAGILLSLGNPYFIIWWATVGAALISRSIEFGILGFLVFSVLHWLCDFVWYYFLSVLSFNGGKFFGKVFQKIAFAICGVFLIFFSGRFIFDAVRFLLM